MNKYKNIVNKKRISPTTVRCFYHFFRTQWMKKKMHRIENYHLYCNDRPYELAYKRLMIHNKKASSLLYFYFVLFLYDFVVEFHLEEKLLKITFSMVFALHENFILYDNHN